jgi:hypothetical protein
MNTNNPIITIPPELTEEEEESLAKEEAKWEKFRQLATNRVNNALKAISLIGKLSNKRAYSYTKEEAAKICQALDEAVDTVRQQFSDKPKQSGFHWD